MNLFLRSTYLKICSCPVSFPDADCFYIKIPQEAACKWQRLYEYVFYWENPLSRTLLNKFIRLTLDIPVSMETQLGGRQFPLEIGGNLAQFRTNSRRSLAFALPVSW